MPKGRKKRKKKRSTAPPLIFADKAAYAVILILAFGLPYAIFILFNFLQKQIVYSSSNVIAYEGTADQLWLLLPLFFYICAVIAAVSTAYTKRVPIFGKKSCVQKSSKKRRPKRTVLYLIAAILIWLSMWTPGIGALYSRTEITDTEVRRYASFGTVTEHIPVSEASSVCARIIWSQNGTRTVTGSWRISYKINFDNGKDYTFSSSTDTMIKIDSLFPDVEKSVTGTEYIDDYFNDNQCSPSQQNAIKKMFMIKQ